MRSLKRRAKYLKQAVVEMPRMKEKNDVETAFDAAFEQRIRILQREYEAVGMDYIRARAKALFVAEFEQRIDQTFNKIKKGSKQE